MQIFGEFVGERIDWFFAGLLGFGWAVAIPAAWYFSGFGFQDRFQTVFFLSALLVWVPIFFVGLRPGAAANQVMIGIAMSLISLLAEWAFAPVGPGWPGRVWVGVLPIALLAFYPRPHALVASAILLVSADLASAAGILAWRQPIQPLFWFRHSAWLILSTGGLTYLNLSRARWIRELLDRQLNRHPSPEDELTGLPLRERALGFLQNVLANCESETIGVIAVDIDRLRHINETLGECAGDAVLTQAASRFASCLHPRDHLARAGQDSFLIILPALSGSTQAEILVRRLLECIQTPFEFNGRLVFATASFGVALAPEHGRNAKALVEAAEQAVEASQRTGRLGYKIFAPELQANDRSLAGLESDLHQALEQGQLELHYQPQVNPAGRLVCVEALLRWRHPVHGLVPPVDFIPLSEASGLILPIGEWVLHEACRQGAEWVRAGLPPTRIAVNVSPVQFARTQFVEQVALALASTGFEPRLLELELTETLLMVDHERACDKITRLQSMGIQISIDDFGMGYSSLAYIQQLPVNALKVDRSFVAALDASPTGLSLLAAIIMLAHSLNLEVVVEGIETDAQRQVVWSLGADKAQGYYFARPQPAAGIERLLRTAGQLAA
ncbi:MAG: EAL domain-containing protein [Bryobacteraceae bacterium]